MWIPFAVFEPVLMYKPAQKCVLSIKWVYYSFTFTEAGWEYQEKLLCLAMEVC